MDSGIFHTLTTPHVMKREPEHGFLLLRMPDGGEADVYARCEPDGTLAGVTLSHFSRGAGLDLIADLAKALKAAVVLQEGVALVADTEQRGHLVPELRHEAVVVELNGEAIQNAIDQQI